MTNHANRARANPAGAYMGVYGALAGNGRNAGQSFPSSDTDDFGKGARFIPSNVTCARRRGHAVRFVQDCGNACCWYWEFRDGSRMYHFERYAYDSIRDPGNPDQIPECPACGNPRTNGGAVASPEARRLDDARTKFAEWGKETRDDAVPNPMLGYAVSAQND